MSQKCHKCNIKIINKDYLACFVCKEKYHLDCTVVSDRRFKLMTVENKQNWKCKSCIHTKNKTGQKSIINNQQSPSMNTRITTRKKLINLVSVKSPLNSIDTSSDTTTSSADTLLNRSCPENNIHVWEELEELKTKINLLETKLESAHNEIETLLSENYSLKRELSNRDSKISQLTKIYQSTPKIYTPRQPKTCRKRVKNTPKLEKLYLEMNTISPQVSSQVTPPAEKPSSTSLKTDGHTPDTDKTTHKPKPRICLLSTNKFNKTRSIATTTFNGNVCHYLMPGAGLKQLIQGITEKVTDFTMNDYCVILIGEEDFIQTTDYFELIACLRETLCDIDNTNILICLPTYKCCTFTNLFNWRVEVFNNLLYLDVTTHKYAYVIDSNRNLKYNNTMFHSRFGSLNNYGLQLVLRNVNEMMSSLKEYYNNINNSFDQAQHKFKEIRPQKDLFFRRLSL